MNRWDFEDLLLGARAVIRQYGQAELDEDINYARPTLNQR